MIFCFVRNTRKGMTIIEIRYENQSFLTDYLSLTKTPIKSTFYIFI
jgi:hypothetical protein